MMMTSLRGDGAPGSQEGSNGYRADWACDLPRRPNSRMNLKRQKMAAAVEAGAGSADCVAAGLPTPDDVPDESDVGGVAASRVVLRGAYLFDKKSISRR